MKIDPKDIHLLRLIRKDKGADGWTKVSDVVWPLVEKLPSKLCELKKGSECGYIRLTPEGDIVLNWS